MEILENLPRNLTKIWNVLKKIEKIREKFKRNLKKSWLRFEKKVDTNLK